MKRDFNFFDKPQESAVVRRVKAERINPGRSYKDYLLPSQRRKVSQKAANRKYNRKDFFLDE